MSPDPRVPISANHPLRRREALGALGALALGAVATRRLTWAPRAAAATTCVLAPEVTEGPYWIDNALTRRDITEGRPGLPLVLDLYVVDATTCRPIANADVEVWHADAGGVYSGFGSSGATNAKRFLRGHQRTDANGRARFTTIYPGWYRGRTPHIHLKVHVGGSVVHTGQVFFPDKVSAAVYRTAQYRSHGQADTRNSTDMIYADAGGSRARLAMTRRAKPRKGYRGAITLGVKR